MDNKKRLMFSLEEDYYYITLKILLILKIFDCSKKPFVDYRKLSVLFEIFKDDKTYNLIKEEIATNFSNNDLIKNDRIIDIVCNAKLNVPVIKRILLFLESKEYIRLEKNKKRSSIDIYIENKEFINEIFDSELFDSDIKIIESILKFVPNARWIKFTTLKEKLFGNNEVIKWDD